MSTQEVQDKPEGLSKYIKRMRTVLKKGSTKSSVSSMKDITGEASTGTPTQAAKAPFDIVEAYVLFNRWSWSIANKTAQSNHTPTPKNSPPRSKNRP